MLKFVAISLDNSLANLLHVFVVTNFLLLSWYQNLSKYFRVATFLVISSYDGRKIVIRSALHLVKFTFTLEVQSVNVEESSICMQLMTISMFAQEFLTKKKRKGCTKRVVSQIYFVEIHSQFAPILIVFYKLTSNEIPFCGYDSPLSILFFILL